MPAPQISPLPTPPSRSQSPETFSADADAFLGALPDFQSEANDQADYLDALAVAVDADATIASNSAAIAAGAANYQGDYNAGTTYQIGESVSYTGRRYVAKTVNTGVTPADGANWFLINDGDVLGPVSATANGIALYDGTTGKILKSGLNNGTAGQALISGGSGNAPVWGAVEGGVLPFTASGSITAGNPVSLLSNGNVEAVTGAQQSQSISSRTTFTMFQADNDFKVGQIGGTNKFVAFGAANADSSYVNYMIGDATNDTITFGSQTRLVARVGLQCKYLYDSVNNKCVFFYKTGNSVYCITASFNGTNLTVGTELQVTGSANGIDALFDAYFDPTFNGYVVVWRDTSNYLRASSLLPSGTSVSVLDTVTAYANTIYSATGTYTPTGGILAFVGLTVDYLLYTKTLTANASGILTVGGTLNTFISGANQVQGNYLFSRWSTYYNRLFVLYMNGNSRPCVANATAWNATPTISTLETSGTFTYQEADFDLTAQRFVMSYRNNSTGLISVKIAYGSTLTVETVSSDIFAANVSYTHVAYIASRGRNVIVCNVGGGTSFYALSFAPAALNTNAYGFIGIATTSASNGQSVSVATLGGKNNAVSGLVTGTNYFLTFNGLLATSGLMRVGVALSATSILIEDSLANSGTPSASTFLRGDGAWTAITPPMVLLASGTTTAAASSILVNDISTTGFSAIIFELSNLMVDQATIVNFGLVAPAGTVALGNFELVYIHNYSNATAPTGLQLTNTMARINPVNTGASSRLAARFVVHNVNLERKPVSMQGMGSWNGTANAQNVTAAGIHNISTIGGFIVSPTAGNLGAGAQYRIYGVI